MNRPRLSIVVPCYNEEDVVDMASKKLLEVVNHLVEKGKIDEKSYILFVDDGSSDRTWPIIRDLNQTNQAVKGLRLSANCGHQKALLAGLLNTRNRCDCVVTIDADLQDDVTVIEKMVDKYIQGNDIVYGVRKGRKVDSLFKRTTAQCFYAFLSFLDVKTVYNHADFRLISKKIVAELSKFREVNLYLRGIFPLLGFRTSEVYYERKGRTAGVTKYPLRKMLSFAWDSVTSFSIFPMRLILVFGIIVLSISFVLFLWAFGLALIGKSIPGWASTVIPIYVLGGLQMAGIGLLGEYIGKIYGEVKSRPRFIIDEELG
ncbi:MAG: glycosyltransferase family 2 protein [Thermodesulfobacteriota bacterium]|nr:glycosyltransferase family 2 protein [Thermodesulfobacteriota bacterium]